MFDPSGLTNATGNAGRSYQGPSTPGNFSSLGNLFTGASAPGWGTGAAPMNLQPQNQGAQPGMNLPGFMQFLGGAFNNTPGGWQGGLQRMAAGLPADSIGGLLGSFNAPRKESK